MALQRALSALGYRLDATGEYGQATSAVVSAFQRHWRPARVDGRADSSTRTQVERIAALTRK